MVTGVAVGMGECIRESWSSKRAELVWEIEMHKGALKFC